MKNIGLYIHIPFCSGKCPYCDFFSISGNNAQMDEYCEYLTAKLRSYKNIYHADTIYFGGGTPSLLGTDRLCALLDAARDGFSADGETTIEVNPRSVMTLDMEKLAFHGINRVSIGLQSANDNELVLLGRRHTAKDAQKAVSHVKAAGIDNISLDLMLGISNQTKSSLENSISFCHEQECMHISAYILKIEEGTPYYKRRSTLDLPDEDEVCGLYEYASERLSQLGYHQYEISNFAKPGRQSRHNLKYWHCEEYLGIGPAAHSFIDGKRFYFDRSFDDFYRNITVPDGEGGGKEEYIALALRLTEGVRFEAYKKRYGENFPSAYIQNAQKLVKTGLVSVGRSSIAITQKGFLVSNAVIAGILYG